MCVLFVSERTGTITVNLWECVLPYVAECVCLSVLFMHENVILLLLLLLWLIATSESLVCTYGNTL